MKNDPKIIRGNLKEKKVPKALKVGTEQPEKFISFKEYLTQKNDRSTDDR